MVSQEQEICDNIDIKWPHSPPPINFNLWNERELESNIGIDVNLFLNFRKM